MVFKKPARGYRRSSVSTPIVTSSSHRRSSSVARSSPTQPATGYAQKRLGLVSQSQRGSAVTRAASEASGPPPEINVVSQQNTVHDEDEPDISINEVVMALDMRERGTIGCCYYAAAKEALYLMADIKSAGLEVVDLCR